MRVPSFGPGRWLGICLLLAAPWGVGDCGAEALPDTVALGERIGVYSSLLGEDREVLVHLPPGYRDARQRYPVLYILDGNNHFAHAAGIADFLASRFRAPGLIVVAVPTLQRRAFDMTPPLRHRSGKADAQAEAGVQPVGGAEAFLGFLAEELAPWVDAHYRTEPFRILSGHSLGGLFAVYALLQRPESFNAYIAVSPSLWWDERAYVKLAGERLGRLKDRRFLYFSWGDGEAKIGPASRELADLLERRMPANLSWAHRYYPGDDHATTPLRTLHDGLEWLYAGWWPPVSQWEKQDCDTLAELVREHAGELSRRYGYRIEPSPIAASVLGDRLSEQGRHEQALALAREYVARYPEIGWLHVRLSQVLEELGRPAEALASYRQSLQYPNETGNIWEIRHRLRVLEEKAGAASGR